MDIRKLLEDGTIQKAIEVLESNSGQSMALKKTIDALHRAMVNEKKEDIRKKELQHRMDKLERDIEEMTEKVELELLKNCIEV